MSTGRVAGLSQAAIGLLRDMAAERVLRVGERDRWWLVDEGGCVEDQPVDLRLMAALTRRDLVRIIPPNDGRYGGRLVDVYRAVPSLEGESVLDLAAAADQGEP